MIISLSLIAVGFLLLIIGARWFVSGASSFAKKNKISDLAIGLTIVAFGTSAPELIVNSVASYNGHADIVLGNIIGSNNINLFIILGISGLILPITVQSSTVWYEIPISVLAAISVLFLANGFFMTDSNLLISRIDGFILFVLFILFLFYAYKQMKDDDAAGFSYVVRSDLQILGLVLGGFLGLAIGGNFVVDNSVDIAASYGVSKKIIGLTILALGTSLPELMTSVVAAIKKNSDIAIGNVIGSNIFNLLFILSVSSFIRPTDYNLSFNIDIYIFIGGTFFLFIAMFTGIRKKLDRWEAALLLVSYLVYTGYLVSNEI